MHVTVYNTVYCVSNMTGRSVKQKLGLRGKTGFGDMYYIQSFK